MTPLAAPPARRPTGLLRYHDFRLFWLGQTTSRFGSAITAVALPLVAIAMLEASTFQVALLQAAVWLPWLLIGLPVGVWVDRLPRRPVLITCDVVSLTLYLSVPVAAWAGALTIGHLLVVALLAGAASVFFETAYQVYLPSLLHGGQLAEGNAKLQGSESAAQVAGPGVGGLLTHAFGAVSNLALIGYQAIPVVFLIRENGVSSGAVGGIIAAMSTGGLIGAAIATRVARRFGTARGMLICQLGAAPFALLIPLARPGAGLAAVVIGGIVVGAGIVAGNVIKGTFRQTYTPRHLLGLRPTMWLMTSALVLASTILLIGPIRRHRDLPVAPVGSSG